MCSSNYQIAGNFGNTANVLLFTTIHPPPLSFYETPFLEEGIRKPGESQAMVKSLFIPFIISLVQIFFSPYFNNLYEFLRLLVTMRAPYNYTVDENIIATTKMRNNLCYHLKMVIFPIAILVSNSIN